MISDVVLANLTSPPILFFLLGLVATAVRSDLVFPEGLGKAIGVFLLIAIGFKGGAALAETGIGPSLVLAVAAALVLAVTTPLIAFVILRRTSQLSTLDAATIAAHYGSASLVTFLAASSFLTAQGQRPETYLVTLLAVMESPAIVVGMLLARRSSLEPRPGHGLREAVTNGSVVLLLGSAVIGYLSGPAGVAELDGFLVAPFTGILTLFLLDMGLLAGRRLRDSRRLAPALAVFAFVMPLIGGALGLAAGWLLDLSTAGTTILATLSASASYIVAPAAFRHAYPASDTSLAVTLALGLTFPFNLILGIPIYWTVAGALAGL